MIKKIITTTVISTALLMGANNMAKADSMGVVKAKVDNLAMVSESLKLDMGYFMAQPKQLWFDGILEKLPQFKEAMNELSTENMKLCYTDTSCKYYLDMALENVDSIQYLMPKVQKLAKSKS